MDGSIRLQRPQIIELRPMLSRASKLNKTRFAREALRPCMNIQIGSTCSSIDKRFPNTTARNERRLNGLWTSTTAKFEMKPSGSRTLPPLFPLWRRRYRRPALRTPCRPVLQAQPVRDLLRIETNRAPHVKARQLSTSSHPVDVLVVNAEKFAKF